jgi:mono/diheme cytochrome c family protein
MSAPTPNPMPDNIDYSHTSNVARMHAAAAREKGEPAAKPTPISLSVVAAIAAVAILAGSYRGANSGDDLAGANVKGYNYPLNFKGLPPVVIPEPDPIELHQPQNWIAVGKGVYGTQCGACHQATGEGMPGQYPPLKGSEFVVKGEKRLAAILLHGITGALTVNGKPFNGTMEPIGTQKLNDVSLAQVLSYIRNDWSNQASVIYEDQIKALKKELGARPPYSEAELREIPEDANGPPSEWPAKLLVPAAGTTPAAGTAAPPAAGAPAPTTPGTTTPAPAPATTPPPAPAPK